MLSDLCTMPNSELKVPIDKEYIAAEADIPDSVIDHTLCQYKEYFTNESWNFINQISMQLYAQDIYVIEIMLRYHINYVLHVVAKKKEEWRCDKCLNITTKLNMIFCDACRKWFHW